MYVYVTNNKAKKWNNLLLSLRKACVSLFHRGKNREDEQTRVQQRQSGREEAAGQGLSTQEDQAQVKAISVGIAITGAARHRK